MARRYVFLAFLSVVLLAPLPFASNRPWSWSLLSALIGALMIMEALTTGDRSEVLRRFLIRMAPGLVLIGVVATWAWLQTVTGLPAEIVHPLWLDAATVIGHPVEPVISLDPEATRTALMRLLAYAGVFWVAARFCRDAANAALVLRAFVAASGGYALYGLVLYFADIEMILWFEKWAYKADLTSTFVNRNSYATFAGLGLIASVALIFDQIGERLRGPLAGRQVARISLELMFSEAWLPLLAMLFTATAVLLTHSRGGALSTGLALFVLLVLLIRTDMVPRKIGYGFLAVSLLVSAFAFTMSGDLVVERLRRTTLESSIRDELFARVIEAVEANPLWGAGYGTFETAFKAFKTPELSYANWDKAHNSYLELAFELGLPATAVIVLVFAWLAGVCAAGLIRRRRRQTYAAVGLSATVLVAAHASVDFSLQIPGFTVSYALLLGLAWAQSWPTRRRAE